MNVVLRMVAVAILMAIAACSTLTPPPTNDYEFMKSCLTSAGMATSGAAMQCSDLLKQYKDEVASKGKKPYEDPNDFLYMRWRKAP